MWRTEQWRLQSRNWNWDAEPWNWLSYTHSLSSKRTEVWNLKLISKLSFSHEASAEIWNLKLRLSPHEIQPTLQKRMLKPETEIEMSLSSSNTSPKLKLSKLSLASDGPLEYISRFQISDFRISGDFGARARPLYKKHGHARERTYFSRFRPPASTSKLLEM